MWVFFFMMGCYNVRGISRAARCTCNPWMSSPSFHPGKTLMDMSSYENSPRSQLSTFVIHVSALHSVIWIFILQHKANTLAASGNSCTNPSCPFMCAIVMGQQDMFLFTARSHTEHAGIHVALLNVKPRGDSGVHVSIFRMCFSSSRGSASKHLPQGCLFGFWVSFQHCVNTDTEQIIINCREK